MDAERAALYPFTARPGTVPLRIAKAEGAYLVTADGTRILDAAGGAVVVNIGHGRQEVADAYARAVVETTYVVPPFATESRVALVERLRADWLPEPLTRCVFTSGGSESMDAAIRLARQHFRSRGEESRWKVIGRDLSYHGTTLATLAIGGHTKRRASFEPWFPELPKAPACYCARCPLGLIHPQCAVACASALEEVIEREGAGSIAAFVAEPIGGSTAGALVPPDDYWPRIAEICSRHGILLIADEVMTGFGRTGRKFAVDHWKITPDVLVGGKGLTGGYAPLGGIFASERVIEPIAERGDELMFFTYSGHPAACAAADKVLEILVREELVERAAQMGRLLRERLAKLEGHPHVLEVRGRGLLQAVELVRDRATGEPFAPEAGLTAKVVAAGVAEGVFFYPGGCGPAQDVITLGPPFIIDEAQVEKIASALEAAIDSAVARVLQRSAR
jgi:adenosylmethionine-8-amino-7-oxononanoate aminotransferase